MGVASSVDFICYYRLSCQVPEKRAGASLRRFVKRKTVLFFSLAESRAYSLVISYPPSPWSEIGAWWMGDDAGPSRVGDK